ncbi:hypothetical protein D3C72_2511890 [compost metagenome]
MQARLKQLVLGCDDILDFRTRLRLLKRERVDEDGLVRNTPGAPFQFRQMAVRASRFAKHRRRFKIPLRRKARNGIGGF